MANVISVKEAAMRWELAERTVRGLCIGGKIPGAVKNGRSWLIPAGAEKPVDNRIKTGAYVRAKSRPKHLPLPVGVSDYRLASTEYYYIDKTMMLKDFIDERPMVTLFTRRAVLVKLSIWICFALSLKKQTRILQSISRIKRFGSKANIIALFKASTP